ncbi:MAG: TetR family transcriptional regulator [Lysobacteraceae bacterium]
MSDRITRKPGDAREKDLLLALSRIQRGRAHTKETKVTIASVAREAGVSTALIHNHYPRIADTIREAQGRSSRAVRDLKHQELRAERERNKTLRAENAELTAQVAKLASINEVLLAENRTLKAMKNDPKVVDLASRKQPTN